VGNIETLNLQWSNKILWVPYYTLELNPVELLFSHWFLNPEKSSGVKWHACEQIININKRKKKRMSNHNIGIILFTLHKPKYTIYCLV